VASTPRSSLSNSQTDLVGRMEPAEVKSRFGIDAAKLEPFSQSDATPQSAVVASESAGEQDQRAGTAADAQSHALEERLKIKDLDTGRLFYLDTGEWVDGAVPSRGESQVTDMQSGQSMTMEEFDEALGIQLSSLHKEMAKRGLRVVVSGDEDDEDEESTRLGKGLASLGSSIRTMAGKAQRRVGRMSRSVASANSRKLAPQHPTSSTDDTQGDAGRKLPEAKMSEKTSRNERPSSPDSRDGKGKKGKQRNRTKVYVHRKLYREFTDVRMGQELKAHKGAVWCMKMSLDGQYLASAGQDTAVRVWQFLNPAPSEDSSVPVYAGSETDRVLTRKTFASEPYRVYQGHKSDVLELCWSKTNFLISASMDKTVRLWHASMDECLRVFEHSDFVTAVEFNPLNDKYFISGSLDEKLRLWNIPDHKVEDWVDIGEMITAVCFSNSAKTAIVGSYKGTCRFYSVEDSKFSYVTHLDVRSTRGKNSTGKKITGLQFMPGDDSKLLVTSNDSRLRVYDGYTLKCKYKGHKNSNSQIKASFGAFGDFIVCGSEDECVYVWSTVNSYVPSINPIYTGYRKDRHASYECFPAHSEIVTSALVAPRQYYCVRKVEVTERGPPSGSSAERLRGRTTEAEAQAALAAGERAVTEAAGTGLVLITAGYGGEIRIFENYGLPEWI